MTFIDRSTAGVKFTAVEAVVDDDPAVTTVSVWDGICAGAADAIATLSVMVDEVTVGVHVNCLAHRWPSFAC
jgi:sulfopyruvate decarboxylase TPP-binding subunit